MNVEWRERTIHGHRTHLAMERSIAVITLGDRKDQGTLNVHVPNLFIEMHLFEVLKGTSRTTHPFAPWLLRRYRPDGPFKLVPSPTCTPSRPTEAHCTSILARHISDLNRLSLLFRKIISSLILGPARSSKTRLIIQEFSHSFFRI